MFFRTGSSNDRSVYVQTGSLADKHDRYVCSTQTREGSVVIATALNKMFKEDLLSTAESKWELAQLISVDAHWDEDTFHTVVARMICRGEGHRFEKGSTLCRRCDEPRGVEVLVPLETVELPKTGNDET